MLNITLVEDIVDRHLEEMKVELKLTHYTTHIIYERLDGETLAECDLRPEYQTAWISIDPACADSEADVVRALWHELLHVTHAEFLIFKKAVDAYVPDGPQARSMESLWVACAERHVAFMERLFPCINTKSLR